MSLPRYDPSLRRPPAPVVTSPVFTTDDGQGQFAVVMRPLSPDRRLLMEDLVEQKVEQYLTAKQQPDGKWATERQIVFGPDDAPCRVTMSQGLIRMATTAELMQVETPEFKPYDFRWFCILYVTDPRAWNEMAAWALSLMPPEDSEKKGSPVGSDSSEPTPADSADTTTTSGGETPSDAPVSPSFEPLPGP